jgi:Na+-transporting methylmalonyl-CoA/oxaloacetate decarboxylase gamma subunit
VRVKLIILLIVLIIAMVMYLASEFVHRKYIQELAVTTAEGEENALQPLKSTNVKPENDGA